jgi:EAL and modified HD-GYP domain-containing signal transduction protein
MNVFVARQPIFDRKLKVFGYELLFRSGPDACFSASTDIDYASSQTVSAGVTLMGLENVALGKRAFINVSRGILVDDLAMTLPKNKVVVELLESIEPDDAVLAACRRLKQAGYLIALDDFIERENDTELVKMADFVKVDFQSTTPEKRDALARTLGARGMKMLAEKVETREEVREAGPSGYMYFQGYFFSKPTLVATKDIPGFRLNYLRLLQELNRPEASIHKLEEIIKLEMSIAYRILRYVNSAAFGFRGKINSIREALVLLGQDLIRKWTSVWALAGLGQDKPTELVVGSVIRGICCEALGPKAGITGRGSELFLLGTFSMVDAIMDRPMEEVLSQLSLPDDVRDALLSGGNPLRSVLDCTVAFERGEWEACAKAAADVGIPEEEVPAAFHKASEWATKVFASAA